MMKSAVLAFWVVLISMANAYADSCWSHQGSIIRLKLEGERTILRYDEPRAELIRFGIVENTPLFVGITASSRLIGEAFHYSTDCPGQPFRYQIEGRMNSSNNEIRFEGIRNAIEDCRLSGGVDTVLIKLNFLRDC